MDHSSGLVFRRPQAASHRRAVVYFCSAVLRRPRLLPPTARNHVWAYDFVFDTCANRQTLKCLTIVDEWTRECLTIDVAGGIRSGRVTYSDITL